VRRILEVIACSVADAVAAESGGAGRLEVVSRLEVGGLTPGVDLVREILAAVSIPIRVMVRENSGYDVASESEFENLCAAARAFDQLGIDGLVLGFLRSGHLDLASTERVLGCAPRLRATFHRAFEALEHPEAAIAALKKSGRFDRILTSGDSGRLRQYAAQAGPEISIMAGGGMSAELIRNVIETTSVREFHVGRAARHAANINEPVDASRVRSLATLLSA